MEQVTWHTLLPRAFDPLPFLSLFFFWSPTLAILSTSPLLSPKETENGLPSACEIWLKLVWFPLRKGWQSPQRWLVLKTITCSYLPSWHVVRAGAGRLAGWLWGKPDRADFREIEILWWKPGVNKAVTIGVRRKLPPRVGWRARAFLCACTCAPSKHLG